MFSTNVTIYHHLISQAGWNRCTLSIYLSIFSLLILRITSGRACLVFPATTLCLLSLPLVIAAGQAQAWVVGALMPHSSVPDVFGRLYLAFTIFKVLMAATSSSGSADGPGSTGISPAWLERVLYPRGGAGTAVHRRIQRGVTPHCL